MPGGVRRGLREGPDFHPNAAITLRDAGLAAASEIVAQ
jgi:hypothetical protein